MCFISLTVSGTFCTLCCDGEGIANETICFSNIQRLFVTISFMIVKVGYGRVSFATWTATQRKIWNVYWKNHVAYWKFNRFGHEEIFWLSIDSSSISCSEMCKKILYVHVVSFVYFVSPIFRMIWRSLDWLEDHTLKSTIR